MDEILLYLNMVPNKVIAQEGEKNVVVRKQNQERIRITCLLTVCTDAINYHHILLLKGKILIIEA